MAPPRRGAPARRGRARGGGRVAAGPGLAALDQSLRAERDFLALCIALPQAGAEMLAAIDPEELLTSEVLRRAAWHLREQIDAPLSHLPPDDEPLAKALADLVARAGRGRGPSPERLEHAQLVLERSRIDRAIARGRARGGSGINELALSRERILERIHEVVSRLEGAL